MTFRHAPSTVSISEHSVEALVLIANLVDSKMPTCVFVSAPSQAQTCVPVTYDVLQSLRQLNLVLR